MLVNFTIVSEIQCYLKIIAKSVGFDKNLWVWKITGVFFKEKSNEGGVGEETIRKKPTNPQILSALCFQIVFLQCDRYVEFHSQHGRYYRTRIPKFGRDFSYHYPSCDLYFVGARYWSRWAGLCFHFSSDCFFFFFKYKMKLKIYCKNWQFHLHA